MDEGAEALVQGLEGSSISVGDPSCHVSRVAICVHELCRVPNRVLRTFVCRYELRS